MSDYFIKGSYPVILRVTIQKDSATYNLTGKTVTVKVESPSGAIASFTVGDGTLSIYNLITGIIELTSIDATLWNEVGIFQIQPKVDNLPANIVFVEVRRILE